MDVILAGKEETLTDWEACEAFALLASKLEDVRKNVDSGRRLLEKKLH
jgi:hypothetical protein